MPGALMVLGASFAVVAMVLIGLPPLSGFLAKFSILTAILGPDTAGLGHPGAMRATLAGLLIFSGLVCLIALSRMGIRLFWAPVERFTPRATITETAPIIFLATMLVVVALTAGPLMELFLATARDLHDPTLYMESVLNADRIGAEGEPSP
jgi:multicomponent K+:H+ antiporter subunit D